MRVSEYFKLGRSQPSLDFVEVDVRNDTKVFVDPRAIRLLQSPWAGECVALIPNFFGTVLADIKRGADDHARDLLVELREPNETHMGLSRGRPQGRAVGTESAQDVWEALSRSQAAQSGLLEDLEDTILMVPGISSDIVSDIATNIILQPFIEYTNEVAKYYGIPLEEEVDSGPLWDPKAKRWFSRWVPLPVTEFGKLLLVPKAIVGLSEPRSVRNIGLPRNQGSSAVPKSLSGYRCRQTRVYYRLGRRGSGGTCHVERDSQSINIRSAPRAIRRTGTVKPPRQLFGINDLRSTASRPGHFDYDQVRTTHLELSCSRRFVDPVFKSRIASILETFTLTE